MDKKEEWTNEVLDSLTGIKRASPDDDLFDKILAQIPESKESKVIPIRYLGWIAAVACILITINIYALKLQGDKSNDTTNELDNQTTLLTDYTF